MTRPASSGIVCGLGVTEPGRVDGGRLYFRCAQPAKSFRTALERLYLQVLLITDTSPDRASAPSSDA